MAVLRFHGDSIVNGALLASPVFAWPQIITAKLGLPMTNTAVNGSMAWDQAGAVYDQVIASDDISFLSLGTNDAATWGGGVNRIADYANAMTAMMAWLAIPDASKIRARTGATFTGTWDNTVGYSLGKVSRENGAKATLLAPGPITYLGFSRNNAAFGTASIKVNSVEVGTFATGLNAPPDTYLGHEYGPSLVRLPGLTTGDTIDIEVTSTTGGSNWLYFDWFAAPVPGPRVILGTPTRKWCEGYTMSGGSDRVTLLYRNAVKAKAQMLIDDGLDITVVDMYRVINPAADLFQRRPDPTNAIDWVHWNEAGHDIGADAYLAAI